MFSSKSDTLFLEYLQERFAPDLCPCLLTLNSQGTIHGLAVHQVWYVSFGSWIFSVSENNTVEQELSCFCFDGLHKIFSVSENNSVGQDLNCFALVVYKTYYL